MKNESTVNENLKIFDDTFRTAAKKLPFLFIPLINDCFGTDYSEDEPIHQQCNDLFTPTGKLITDSVFTIRNKTYHIECQSTDDKYIAIRMLEYDFQIAIDSSSMEHGIWKIPFPSSCILFLRGHEKVRQDKVCMVLPDGKLIDYPIKAMYIRDISLDEMFERDLLLLLPFYIMRFEDESNSKAGKSDEFVQKILNEIDVLCSKLLKEESSSERSLDYYNLLGMVRQVANHVFRKNDVARREVDDFMGGEILKLQSEIVFEQARTHTLYELVSDHELSPSSAAKRLGISIDQLKADMTEAGFSFPEIQPA